MADTENGFGLGDILKAATALAVVVALQAGANALLAQNAKADLQSLLIAVKQPVPPALIWVGDYARAAPMWAYQRAKDGTHYGVRLISDGRLDSIARIYLADDYVGRDGNGYVTTVNGLGADDIDGRYIDQRVRILTRLGQATETYYSEIGAALPEWTAAHRGDNTGSLAIICSAPEAKFFGKAFPYGYPENLTVVARGVCYDWRDPSQARLLPETWKWSASPVIWLTHLEWYRWGLDWTRQIQPVLADLTAEANICDEAVPLAAGGTEKRYRVAGVYKDDTDWDSVRQKILATMDGQRTLDGLGRLVITAGKYRAPTVTLTASDITASDWQTSMPTERRVDRLQVFFTSPEAGYAKAQCDDWIINEDGSAVEDFYVEWSPSFSQTRRLVKRFAARRMPPSQGPISTNIGGLKTWAQRFVRVQYDLDDDAGITDINIEVRDGIEPQGLSGFNLAGVQVSAAIDSWNPATEEGNAPEAVVKVTPGGLTAPTINSITMVSDGTNIRLHLSTTNPQREGLTPVSSWRTPGGIWNDHTSTDFTTAGGGVMGFDTDVVALSTALEVRAAYLTGSGNLSKWSDVQTLNTALAPPLPPTEFSATGGTLKLSAQWREPNSLALAGTRLVRAAAGALLGTAVDISGLKMSGLGAVDAVADLAQPAGLYDLWAVSENTGGIQCNTPLKVSNINVMPAALLDIDPAGLGNGTANFLAADGSTYASFDAMVTAGKASFSRASVASALTAAGVMTTFTSGQAAATDRGLLIHTSRTNLLLNSASLATQSVTVTAQAYTLSFYGAGSVTLSGAHSAVVTGAGTGLRKDYTFTPSAGSLTATVSGTLTYGQIEAGSNATAWIPTTGASVTRSSDAASITGIASLISGDFSLVVECDYGAGDGATSPTAASTSDNTANNRINLYRSAGGSCGILLVSGGIQQTIYTYGVGLTAQRVRFAATLSGSRFISAINGVLAAPATGVTHPAAMDRLFIGAGSTGGSRMDGYVRRLTLYPGLTDAQLAFLTA